MDWITGLLFFVFGAVVGSFLNVVILRYHTGKTLRGRSGCTACGTILSWSELLPLVSFCVQGGRCRSCKSKISWQYPLVELLTAVLFVAVYVRMFMGVVDTSYILHTTYYILLLCLFVVIVVYDLKHKIIPDPFVFAAIVITGIALFIDFNTLTVVVPPLFHALAGPFLALPFALLWGVSKGRWMGLGDAKLAWAVGWFLGLSGGVSALVYAFWIGAVVSVLVLIAQKTRLFSRLSGYTIKSEIPFAPFIVLGALIVFFCGFDLVALLVP